MAEDKSQIEREWDALRGLMSARSKNEQAAAEPNTEIGGQDPDDDNPKRFTLFSFIVLFIIAVIGDAFELGTGGTIGIAVGKFCDVIIGISLWFRKKKNGAIMNFKEFVTTYKWFFAAMGVDVIPFLSALPARTANILWYQYSAAPSEA